MSKPSKMAVDLAEQALRDLAKKDLLYCHYGTVNSRGDETYEKLAEYFERYAAHCQESKSK